MERLSRLLAWMDAGPPAYGSSRSHRWETLGAWLMFFLFIGIPIGLAMSQ